MPIINQGPIKGLPPRLERQPFDDCNLLLHSRLRNRALCDRRPLPGERFGIPISECGSSERAILLTVLRASPISHRVQHLLGPVPFWEADQFRNAPDNAFLQTRANNESVPHDRHWFWLKWNCPCKGKLLMKRFLRLLIIQER
jgi:hypothetical protein